VANNMKIESGDTDCASNNLSFIACIRVTFWDDGRLWVDPNYNATFRQEAQHDRTPGGCWWDVGQSAAFEVVMADSGCASR